MCTELLEVVWCTTKSRALPPGAGQWWERGDLSNRGRESETWESPVLRFPIIFTWIKTLYLPSPLKSG